MYILHPVSIHRCPRIISFSLFHPLCLWMKDVVGKEWGHLGWMGWLVIVAGESDDRT